MSKIAEAIRDTEFSSMHEVLHVFFGYGAFDTIVTYDIGKDLIFTLKNCFGNTTFRFDKRDEERFLDLLRNAETDDDMIAELTEYVKKHQCI